MYLERDNVTDRLQKSVYIYTSVITGTDTGPSCLQSVVLMIPYKLNGHCVHGNYKFLVERPGIDMV